MAAGFLVIATALFLVATRSASQPAVSESGRFADRLRVDLSLFRLPGLRRAFNARSSDIVRGPGVLGVGAWHRTTGA
jgi:hypothetical protein